MRAWELGEQRGLASLRQVERAIPVPAEGEALVRVRAAALNHRDLLSLEGRYGPRKAADRIALSDGVGVVETVNGPALAKPGQRVIAPHFVTWIDGPFDPSCFAQDLGITRDGWLAEHIVLPSAALVPVPDSLDDIAAASLSAAGATVWHGLVAFGNVKPGELVLVLGTGGVSILGLQVAKALGARVAITSSSEDKLARCRELGADIAINYRTHPEWAAALFEANGGRGADVILDTVGTAELGQTLAAAAPNARIALIGALAGASSGLPDMFGMIARNLTMKGITSGSREMLAALVELVDRAGIVPLVDRTFPFEQADRACAHLAQGGHMGKVAITF